MQVRFLAVVVVFSGLSCSGQKSDAETNVPSLLLTKPMKLNGLKPLKAGLTFFYSPFESEKLPMVYLERNGTEKVSPKSYVWGAPKTVAGYHWPWLLNAHLKKASPDGSEEVTALSDIYDKDVLFEEQKVFGFTPDPSRETRNRWPAVTGNWTTNGGSVSGLLLSVLKVANLNQPVRLYLLDNTGKGLATVSSLGKSCGPGCYDADSYLSFLDVPVSFAKQGAAPLIFEGQASASEDSKRVRFVLPQSSEPEVFRKFRSELGGLERVATSYEFLNAVIGQTEQKFDFHTIFNSGCGYQGLEHPNSTLLSFGLGCKNTSISKSDANTFINLALHEMIHVWNSKLIFSAENAGFDLAKFDSARTKQLYFYEGFTEGLARLFLAWKWPESEARDFLLESWNATAIEIQAALGTPDSLEEISQRSVSLGYALGAWLALEHTVQSKILRFENLPLSSGQAELLLRDSVGVLGSLNKEFAATDKDFWKQFDFSQFAARRKTVVGDVPKNKGYKSSEVEAALLKNTLAFGRDPLELTQALQRNRLLSVEGFEERFRKIAAAFGREVVREKGKLNFASAVSLSSDRVWYPL